MPDEEARDKLASLAERMTERFMEGTTHPGDEFDAELAALTPDEWRALHALIEQRKAHHEEQLAADNAEAEFMRRMARQLRRSGAPTVGDLVRARGLDPEVATEADLLALLDEMEREEKDVPRGEAS